MMIPLLVVPAMLALAAAPPPVLDLQSDSPCPTADAVRARLPDFLGTGISGQAKVMLRGRGDHLIIEFTWPGAAQAEARHLHRSADCVARAEAAAVVIASWLDVVTGPTLDPPEMHDVGVRPPAPVVPTSTVTTHATVATPAVAPDDPRLWWLGAGLLAARANTFAPGLRAELARTRSHSGIGWMASAQVTTPHDGALGGGAAHWLRPSLAAAAQAHLRAGAILLGVDAGPILGLTVAWGTGYPIDQSAQSLTWGVSGGARAAWALGRLRPWVELRLASWLRGQRLRHDVAPGGSTQSTDVPSLEAGLAVGCSLAVP